MKERAIAELRSSRHHLPDRRRVGRNRRRREFETRQHGDERVHRLQRCLLP